MHDLQKTLEDKSQMCWNMSTTVGQPRWHMHLGMIYWFSIEYFNDIVFCF